MLIRHPKNPEVQDPAPERKRTILDSTHGKSSGAWWCSKRGGRWTISVILIHEDSVEYNIVQYQNQQIYHARVLCLAKIHYDTSDKHEDIGQPCSFWAKMVDTERFEPQVTGYQRGTFMDKARRVGSTTQRVGIEHDGNIFKTVLHLSGHVVDWKIRRKRKQEPKSEEAPAEGPVTGWLFQANIDMFGWDGPQTHDNDQQAIPVTLYTRCITGITYLQMIPGLCTCSAVCWGFLRNQNWSVWKWGDTSKWLKRG